MRTNKRVTIKSSKASDFGQAPSIQVQENVACSISELSVKSKVQIFGSNDVVAMSVLFNRNDIDFENINEVVVNGTTYAVKSKSKRGRRMVVIVDA